MTIDNTAHVVIVKPEPLTFHILRIPTDCLLLKGQIHDDQCLVCLTVYIGNSTFDHPLNQFSLPLLILDERGTGKEVHIVHQIVTIKFCQSVHTAFTDLCP
jgi:hypothetical protein